MKNLSAWIVFPIAGCGLATWIVLAYILATSITRLRHILSLPSSQAPA